jgi:hypothetical protein
MTSSANLSDAPVGGQLYLDENVPLQLAVLLMDKGIMVHLPQDVGTVSAADSVHLYRCSTEGWTLVTQDRRDFRRLHWIWMTLYYWGVVPRPHGGIITILENEPVIPQNWVSAIQALLQQHPTLTGLMFMWHPASGEWQMQPVAFM